MRILTLTGLPRSPHSGQRLRVDHSRLMGLDSGLDPGEQVVLRVRDRHQLATVVHVDFGLDETTYDLMVKETCSSCALNPDSAAGSTLQRHLSALD